MRVRFRQKSMLAAAALTAVLAGVPGEAMAAHTDEPFDVTATIAACGGQSLTIAAEVAPSGEVPRALRRADLRLRFEATPLYGPGRRSREFDLGQTMSALRSARFADLPAQAYAGIVRYRWTHGRRTVASGFVRTRKARVAGRRGKATCTLRVGKPPTDTQAPFILPFPHDARWYRGPLTVYFFVVDDLSGVGVVASRIDGGPFVRGRRTTITGEGEHLLEYVARDAVGNQTPLYAITLRVDENPPTAPALSAPSGTTADSTPDIQWSASTDSASGVAGYYVLVRDSSGAVVWSQIVGPSVTTATVGQTLAVGDYTAAVVAVDGTVPEPFTATGTSGFTVVPPPPGDADGDGVPDASDNCPTVANSNQADEIDRDGTGEACDSDDDNDGVSDSTEISEGADPKDRDSDNDGIEDGPDVCPIEPRGPVDTNNNGCPDPG